MITTTTCSPRVILAADDDQDDLTLLGLLLRKAGVEHSLHLYHQGEDVMAAFTKMIDDSVKAIRPLLCFLDVQLAGMGFSGHDVLRWIRSQPRLDDMPVVMLTDSDSPRDVTTAVQNGAQCYLTKYPQPAVLRQVVDEAERFAVGEPADECFRMPTNQLLVRCRRLSDKR